MGFVFDFIIDVIWISIVDAIAKDRPWWVWALVAISPLLLIALLFGLVYLLTGA